MIRHAVPCLVLLLSGCSSLWTRDTGLREGRLLPCPDAPHCVSSTAADEGQRVEPLRLSTPGTEGWKTVLAAVAATERTTVVVQQDRYARAEVVSPWGVYTDDLELLWDGGARIDVRSSSRIGYYDFKVNRKRVEGLRRRLQDDGVVAP